MTLLNIKIPSQTGGKGHHILLLLIFFTSFGLLKNTPLERVHYFFEIIIIFPSTFFFIRHIFMRKLTTYELYLITLTFSSIALSILRSNAVFDQPLYLGLLSNRSFLMILCVFLIKNIKIDKEKDIHKALILLSYVSIVSFYCISIYINPADFIDTRLVDIRYSGEYRFRFEALILCYPIIYYTISFFHTNKFSFLLLSIPFWSYMLFIYQSRSVNIVLLLVVIVGLLFDKKIIAKIRNYWVYLTIAVVLGMIIILINPEEIQSFFSAYQEVINVLMGRGSEDQSASAREIQFRTFSFITSDVNNMLFGIGKLSVFWNGGLEFYYGRFYPADIGLFGMVTLVGIIGTLLFYTQLLFIPFKKIASSSSLHQKSITLFTLLILLRSFSNAYLFYYPAASVVMLFLLKYEKGYRFQKLVTKPKINFTLE